jgi:hypothetical protein
MAGYVAMFVDEGGAGRRWRRLGVRSECDLFGGKFNPPITQIYTSASTHEIVCLGEPIA